MNNIKSIQAETERHARAMSELIGELKKHILSLPDNPKIKRMGKSNCFTISSKDLGDNWSVEHHDFKKQYELIVKELEATEPANVFNKLQKIISEGKLVSVVGSNWNRSSHRLNLHPDVIAWLRKLADMPPTNCPACEGEREWAGDGIKAECHFCGRTQ